MRKFATAALFLVILGASFLLIACEDCQHTQETVTVIAPTCDKEGYTLHQCTSCDEEYKTDTLPALGHTLKEETVAPTCIDEGYTVYRCDCGYHYKGNFSAPQGHRYESQVVAPTCEKEGYDEQLCSVCGHSLKSNFVSAKGHTFASAVYAPTCSEEGYTEYSCHVCKQTYRADYIASHGHDLVTVASIHPTATESGLLTQKCNTCSFTYTNYLLYSQVFPGAYIQNSRVLAKGIDVSCYQHKETANGFAPLDWTAIKNAGFEFAILKAGSTPRTDSNGNPKGGMDPVFEMNYRDAKAAGIELGVYYYTYANTVEGAKADAQYLLTWLDGKQFEYPIYFDLEDDDIATSEAPVPAEKKALLTECCMAFVNTLRDAGYYGALYTNNNWLVYILETETIKGYCDIWYARYPRTSTALVSVDDNDFTWNVTSYGGRYGMWQYTQWGTIENCGMDQNVDFNYAYKDYPAFIKRLGFNGYMPQ